MAVRIRCLEWGGSFAQAANATAPSSVIILGSESSLGRVSLSPSLADSCWEETAPHSLGRASLPLPPPAPLPISVKVLKAAKQLASVDGHVAGRVTGIGLCSLKACLALLEPHEKQFLCNLEGLYSG